MKRRMHIAAAALALTGALASIGAAYAADNTERALNTQTQQMDSLAATRGEGAVSGRISADFSGFAGSTENSDALVAGLRSGSAVTLTSTNAQGATTSTTFTPPTGRMGYGNVYTSLSLAKQQLAAAGITDPTPAEIEAALMGGTVTASDGQRTTLTGVLELRAQGMGWGEIAKSYGYKLGPVVSGMRASKARLSASTGSPAATAEGSTRNSATTHRSGVVTGAGTEHAGRGHAYGRGIVNGSGSTAEAGQGHGNAYGRGIVTGAGTGAAGTGGYGHGNAYGRGIVSGAGSMSGQANAGSGHGKALGKGH